MGREDSVALVPAQDVTALVPVLAADEIPAQVVFTGPIRAPVTKGDELGKLVFAPEGLPEISVPLYAASDVASGGFMVRIKTVSSHLLNRLQNGPEEPL